MSLTRRFLSRRRPAAVAMRLARWLDTVPEVPPASGPDGCLAHQRIECLICSTVCRRGALRFVPQPGGISLPVVAPERCDGCGHCVSQCPVSALTLPAPE